MRNARRLLVLQLLTAVALSVALVLTGATSTPVHASDFYRVSVTRLDQDLYRDMSSRVLIKTRYCYEYVYGDDAVIVWDGPYSYSNKMVFSSGSACEVAGIYRG
jgi:hypothetical protein